MLCVGYQFLEISSLPLAAIEHLTRLVEVEQIYISVFGKEYTQNQHTQIFERHSEILQIEIEIEIEILIRDLTSCY